MFLSFHYLLVILSQLFWNVLQASNECIVIVNERVFTENYFISLNIWSGFEYGVKRIFKSLHSIFIHILHSIPTFLETMPTISLNYWLQKRFFFFTKQKSCFKSIQRASVTTQSIPTPSITRCLRIMMRLWSDEELQSYKKWARIHEKAELNDCRSEGPFLTCLILLTFIPMRLVSFSQHGSDKDRLVCVSVCVYFSFDCTLSGLSWSYKLTVGKSD